MNTEQRNNPGQAPLKGGHRTGYWLPGIVFSVLFFAGCKTTDSRSHLQRFEFTSAHMGTLFSISLYATNKSSAEMGAEGAFRRVARLDEMMSDYRADSELMRLCDQPFGIPVPVSEDLFVVLEKGQEMSRVTDGAFDVTIGPFVRLWRFSRKKKVLPAAEEIAKARAAVGWKNLKLDRQKRTVTLLAPNMRLDLGGIAKGYAADQALNVLKGRGISRALVAASGDIAIGDAPPGERGWKVGISTIDTHTNELAAALVLRNAGVSTAGDTEQAIEINGIRYSHIVDPKTGLGLTNRVQVTVIGRHATMTDGLDTGLCVMGAERGMEVVNNLPQVAAIILEKKDGMTRAVRSRKWGRVIRSGAAP